MSPGAPVSSAPSCASSAADSAPRTRTAHPARSARTCAQKQTHRCTQCRRTSKDFSALTPYEAKLALHTRVGSGACRSLLWEPPLPQHAPTTNQPWSSERGKERSCYIDSKRQCLPRGRAEAKAAVPRRRAPLDRPQEHRRRPHVRRRCLLQPAGVRRPPAPRYHSRAGCQQPGRQHRPPRRRPRQFRRRRRQRRARYGPRLRRGGQQRRRLRRRRAAPRRRRAAASTRGPRGPAARRSPPAPAAARPAAARGGPARAHGVSAEDRGRLLDECVPLFVQQ